MTAPYAPPAKEAAGWLPQLNECRYVDRIIQVRREYGLTIDQTDADTIEAVLATYESTNMIVLTPTNA